MARKPTEIVPTSLRIRESLRRRVEQAAAQRGVSFNAELTTRVEDSFDGEAKRTLEDIAADFANLFERATMYAPTVQVAPDLITAAKALVAANKKQDSAAIAAAINQVEAAIMTIEKERSR